MNSKEINAGIERQIKKAAGANVEVTNRGMGRWTLSGTPEEVVDALLFLTQNNIMKGVSKDYDKEDGILYVYTKEIDPLPDAEEIHAHA